MKTVWAFLFVVAVSFGALGVPRQSPAIPSQSAGIYQSTNLFSGPKRMVGKQVYDLQPLFNWWQSASQKSEMEVTDVSRADERPLTNWVRVTGKFVQAMYAGWQVDAELYMVPRKPIHMRIVLLNPPAAEKKEFESLLAEKARLEGGIEQATSDHSAASEDAKHYRDQASYDVLGNAQSAYVNGQPSTVAPVLSHWENGAMHKKADRAENAADSALADKKDMSSRLAEVNARLAAISPGHETTFPIDCFALSTGKMYAPTRQWIYDCGTKR